MTWKQNTWMICHTQMIFHKRLTDGWRNVSAVTYSLSKHLRTHLLMLTLTFTYADSDIYLCWLWHLLMLTLTFTYADADIYLCWRWHVPKCACDFKASCTRGRSFSALRHLKTKTEDRLCGLAMLHVHRNDTYRQVNPDAVIKRWDSSGDRKIHLVFTD